jgi:hypothetical protein
MKPGRPGRFFYRLRVHRRRKGDRASTSEADYAALVTAAHRALNAPVVLVWDNLNTSASNPTALANRPWPNETHRVGHTADSVPGSRRRVSTSLAWALSPC